MSVLGLKKFLVFFFLIFDVSFRLSLPFVIPSLENQIMLSFLLLERFLVTSLIGIILQRNQQKIVKIDFLGDKNLRVKRAYLLFEPVNFDSLTTSE